MVCLSKQDVVDMPDKDKSDENEDDLLSVVTKIKTVAGKYAASDTARSAYLEVAKKKEFSARQTDLHFMRTYGANDVVQFIYDALDNGFFFRKKLHVEKFFSPLAPYLKSLDRPFQFGELCLFMTLYYADLAKDVYLIYHFRSKMLPGTQAAISPQTNAFWLAIFYAMIGSVVATELANAFTLVRSGVFKSMSKGKKVLSLLFAPAMPGVVQYLEEDAKRREKEASMEGGDISSFRNSRHEYGRLRARWRANENMLEHLPQLALLLLLICIDKSESRQVDNLALVLLGDRVNVFLAFSSIISLASLVKGHIFYLGSAAFRGGLSLVGKAVLFVYYLLGCLGRVAAFLIFLTPTLGLLDTLMQAEFAVLGTRRQVFEIDADGQYLIMDKEWEKFRLEDKSELMSGNPFRVVTYGVPILVVILHVLGLIYVRRFVLSKTRILVWKDLYAAVCPPLFYDWHHLFNLDPKGSIAVHWAKSWRAFLHYVLLFAVENVCLSLPSALILKYSTDARSQNMEAVFPLLPEEERSALIVNVVLYASVVGFALVLPAMQIMLALIYFRNGHPWSRVLRREVRLLPSDDLEEEQAAVVATPSK